MDDMEDTTIHVRTIGKAHESHEYARIAVREADHGDTETQRGKGRQESWQMRGPLEDEGPTYLPRVCILEDAETTLHKKACADL